MTSQVSRMAQLAVENAAARLRERYIDPRALRGAQARAQPAPLRLRLEPTGHGDADLGRAIMAGRFDLAGVERECAPRNLWRSDAPSLGWAEAAHRFDWLAHLDAVGEERASEIGWAAVHAWLDRYERYDALAWRPDLAARRLRNWLVYASLIAPRGSNRETAGKAMLSGLAVHVEWLTDHWAFCDPGPDRVIAAGALVTAALAIKDRDAELPEALERLRTALSTSIAEDGGAVTRSPSDAFDILEHLIGVMRSLETAQRETPHFLADAARSLALAVRFFRDVDGGLASFHGGLAYADGRIDSAMAELGAYDDVPSALPKTGFQRLREGRTLVLMDVGTAPQGAAARTVHAGGLAATLSIGRRRVIVNCGGGAHLDGEWSASLRSSAAQSTFILDGASSSRPVLASRRGGALRDEAFVGPANLNVERKEEANGSWVLGSHDGYVETHGLSLTRRMFLSADGGDFRGEDRLELEAEGAAAFKRRMNRLRGAAKALGVPFAARFHLHPDVEAEMVAEGEAVSLRLPSGEAWVMRQSGGRLGLEPSVYVAGGGAPVDTRQIVVTGGVTERTTRVRWAFRRVGELSQLELDVGALLEPVAAPAEAAEV